MSTAFLTEAQERLRQQVRAFAEAEIAPGVESMEATGRVEQRLPRLIAKQGWIGVTIDEEFGGMAGGHVAKTIIIEELSRVSAAMGAAAQASMLGTAMIIHFGTDEQKRKWLPRIAGGSCLPTIAVTEPGSGSYVLGIETTAQRVGGEYVLSGRKVYVGNSHVGDLHGVVARTGTGSRGLSAFLVESDRPGLEVIPHRMALGLHGFSFGEIRFDNCRIPASNLIGQEGDGMAVAHTSSIVYGRPNLTAVALGIHQALVEETTRFTQQRKRYGGSLSALPTVRQKLGLMNAQLITARQSAYHAVGILDTGAPADAELETAKFFNVEAVIKSAGTAMEIHGAAGLEKSHAVERLLRDAWHTYAPAGTGDIQLLRLAEHALGESKGQWSRRLNAGASATPPPPRSLVTDPAPEP
jgi:alkylation response protein AidB-like acyl-CoA dehydrogenase